MSNKQPYSSGDLKPAEDLSFNNNGSLRSSKLSVVNDDNVHLARASSSLHLKNLEKHNTHLKNLLDQKTRELSEVVETNSKFISILAHDLRSPFSSILGVLEILKESLVEYDVNEIEKYIDIVSDSASRTLHLLDNLLVWTISQNKEKTFHPVKINLYELIAEEIESSITTARQKQITLDNSIEPGLNVRADLQMVRTILRNLIGNAIKYTNAGGQIIVTATKSKQFVEISVIDNGIGILPQAQRELFKKSLFHSTSGTGNEQGAGLGLLLCKEFVEMHGGKIRVESKPTKGSKFKFTLPKYI
jgi:two-component system, sensor histidine kinase and response regulator